MVGALDFQRSQDPSFAQILVIVSQLELLSDDSAANPFNDTDAILVPKPEIIAIGHLSD